MTVFEEYFGKLKNQEVIKTQQPFKFNVLQQHIFNNAEYQSVDKERNIKWYKPAGVSSLYALTIKGELAGAKKSNLGVATINKKCAIDWHTPEREDLRSAAEEITQKIITESNI